MLISVERNRLYLRFPYNPIDVIKVKQLPERRWNKTAKAWTCSATRINIEGIRRLFGGAEWSDEALALADGVAERAGEREAIVTAKKEGIDVSVLDGVVFQKPPMPHQKEALVLGRDQDGFGYLMDQGTGKTKVVIDDACHNWRNKKIDVVLVITINSIKTNWVIFDSLKDEPEDKDALDDHMPDDVPYIKGVWVSKQNKAIKKDWKKFEIDISQQVTRRDKLVWLSTNIETMSVARSYQFFEEIIKAFDGRVMIVVDESTIIGKSGLRSRAATKLRRLCAMARIMSGTPIIKSPMKAFTQFGFLDPDILGFGSFYAFRNHFAILGGFEGKQILSFKNQPELHDLIASCSYRILKEDCLKLPPQEFHKRRISMTEKQGKAYNEMQQEFVTQNEESGRVEAKIVLEQMLRLQQITGGYLPIINSEGKSIGTTAIVSPDNNPKFQEILHILEEGGDQRFIIWSRFTHEVLAITKMLNDHGIPTMSFYGGLSDAEKIGVRKSFARDKTYRGIAGNPAAGGLGIDEFKAASLVIYVTNSADTERRKQSEDRTHRYGSDIHDKITYFDLIIPNTVDIKMLRIMRDNVKVSQAVLGDAWKEWV